VQHPLSFVLLHLCIIDSHVCLSYALLQVVPRHLVFKLLLWLLGNEIIELFQLDFHLNFEIDVVLDSLCQRLMLLKPLLEKLLRFLGILLHVAIF
jgi:hypothetical protein